MNQHREAFEAHLRSQGFEPRRNGDGYHGNNGHDWLTWKAALAQLGTGSGAGAQSDSGADSGHATSAVPCLHPSVSEALHLAQRVIEGTLDWDIKRKFIVPYKVRDPLHVANAAIYTALAKVEAKEKTR